MSAIWSPGSVIRARGREWIVLAGSDADILRVRTVCGSEGDQTVIHLGLESEPVVNAAFLPPTVDQQGSQDAALLLRDALLLSLRRGAGPFRSFGQISVEPRAYQLVPLLMALKQDTVRLLIADDVGVGKTIEGALIARELLDRGEIDRTAVLCPPHLVDQWVRELEIHFHIHAVGVTAANAKRLENGIPPGESIFTAFHHTVVSLDYIKSETRRHFFLQTCPDFVIVDEAHTCASTGQGRHQRHELLRALADSPTRHMVFLTATPHSGDEEAFYRLLGLLDRDFARIAESTGDERTGLRDRLSQHFVQRRRPDITEWQEGKLFPRRETKELTYRLTGAWEKFFGSVLDYCADVVNRAGPDERRQRLNFWGTLALMRCVASSPAAARQALRSRAGLDDEQIDEESLGERLFDGAGDSLPDDDVEPPAALDDPALARLIDQAERLAGQAGDPKLKLLTEHLGKLLADGFNPIVFCRYIATANYLGEHLKGRFSDVKVEVVTGVIPSEEREEIVEQFGEAENGRLLIATDCLSEGVNLQQHFNAVVHYDLSWNPTRHEQREGRVDRFGQNEEVVRTTLMYGANNPVDGAVLEVILRKAAKIREELGVPVPLPDDGHTLTQTLMRAVILRHRDDNKQQVLDFGSFSEAKAIDDCWQDVAEKAKRNRTVFAQRRLKPDEVLPEWKKTLAAVGGKEDVQRFTGRALARLGAGLEPLRRGFKVPLSSLPSEVKERLEAEGLSGNLRIDFSVPPAPRCHPVLRSHPLVSVLAESLLERSLADDVTEGASDPSVLGRAGCWVSSAVQEKTIVALVRLRHHLQTQKAARTTALLVEEATAFAWASAPGAILEDAAALALLTPPPVGDPPPHVRRRMLEQSLVWLAAHSADLENFANRRAQALLADHRRVREASDARGSYSVKAILPADVIGLYVLLPRVF
jgi:superfamily II DNA or RNA helicase